jgi:hypothetical protein
MKTASIVAVVLVLIGLGGVATGPEWTVDTVQPAGQHQVVTCHEKFHTEHTKTTTVPPTTAVKHGDACP